MSTGLLLVSIVCLIVCMLIVDHLLNRAVKEYQNTKNRAILNSNTLEQMVNKIKQLEADCIDMDKQIRKVSNRGKKKVTKKENK